MIEMLLKTTNILECERFDQATHNSKKTTHSHKSGKVCIRSWAYKPKLMIQLHTPAYMC
jgi:hypothetical protein